jgi:hypothetical protein
MSHFSNPLDQLRRQRRVAHLYRLGPRAIDELLVEVAAKIGGGPTINRLLVEYERRLTPELLRAVGGNQFSRGSLRAVPADLGNDADLSK